MTKLLKFDEAQLPRPVRGEPCAITVVATWSTALDAREFGPARVVAFLRVGDQTMYPAPLQPVTYTVPPRPPKAYRGTLYIPADVPGVIAICASAEDGSGNYWSDRVQQPEAPCREFRVP